MKNRVISSRVFTIFLGFLLIATLSGGTIAQSSKEEFVYPKSFEIVADKIHEGGKSKIRSRNIYVYLDEDDFSLETTLKIVEELRNENCSPFILGVTIFTNREMLERLIKFNGRTVSIDFNDTPEGREAASKFYQKFYPASTGYFRVDYSRNVNYETFDYSPDKDSGKMVRKYFKSANSGDLLEPGSKPSSCQVPSR